MASNDLVAVTGATGGVGGRVARRLAGRGVAQRLVVRDPSRAPDLPGAHVARAAYGEGDAMRTALAGVSTLLLVSGSEAVDRVAAHVTAVAAAVEAGVGRIVYLSFLAAAPDATFTLARHHWQTEEHIRSTGIEFTFLRDSIYLDFFVNFVGPDGVIRGPAADGKVGAVARDDIADAAVAVLLGTDHDGRTYDLTGPQALTMYEAADELSRATGRPIRYQPETESEAYASRAHYGAPDWEVEGWVTTYTAIAVGELALVSDAVATLTGHAPMNLAQCLSTNPTDVDLLRARLSP